MNGIILNYDPKSATGIVRTEDGKMFPFHKSGWHESRAPQPGDKVDFEAEGEKAKDIYLFHEPLPAKAASIGSGFDLGLVAGGYAIVFFAAAIFDALFHALDLDANDMIGLLVLLDLLTLAAWIWGTKNKLMRGIATACAVSTTALGALLLARHALQ